MTREPVSRDKLQVVPACLRHATNTFGPAHQISRLASEKTKLSTARHPLERRNGDQNAVQRPRLAPRSRRQRTNPD
jgi:hypothetical protein